MPRSLTAGSGMISCLLQREILSCLLQREILIPTFTSIRYEYMIFVLVFFATEPSSAHPPLLFPPKFM